MDYEEIKLMIANRQAEETKNNISKQKVLYENSSRKQDDYSFYNKLYEQDTVGEDFYRFKTQLTESYVTEALTILVDNCVEPVLINEVYNQKLVRQLVSNFVKEEGASIEEVEENGNKKYICMVCGYVYEGETLPDDYVCPLCKHPASDFEPIK